MLSVNTTCLLLEDDNSSMLMIENIIKDFFLDIKVVACKSLEEARRAYLVHRPSLLILDVNLPDGLSFEWLRELSIQEHLFSVIFTTAYSNYAVEAFKFSALDFLLKPFTPHELVKAINKSLKVIDDRNYRMQLEAFFYNFRMEKAIEKKVVLKTVDEIRLIAIKDILAVEADNSYSKFYLMGGKNILVSQSIKEFDVQLSSFGFMRVHQSYLIHLCYIHSFKKKSNLLLLEEGLLIPVSLNKRPLVIEYLHNLK